MQFFSALEKYFGTFGQCNLIIIIIIAVTIMFIILLEMYCSYLHDVCYVNITLCIVCHKG